MRFGWRPMWAFLISRSILGALICQFLLSKLRADGEPAIGHEHRVAKLIAWYPIRSPDHGIPLLEPRRPSTAYPSPARGVSSTAPDRSEAPSLRACPLGHLEAEFCGGSKRHAYEFWHRKHCELDGVSVNTSDRLILLGTSLILTVLR